jgi:hypothetical protein
MSEREGEERLQYAHKCSKWPPSQLQLGQHKYIYPLSKTSRYGPNAPFLRTCGRSAIQARIVRTRIPTTINDYKNVRAFKNDLRTVCPSGLDGPRYIKLSQNEVLLTLHICWNLYCGRSAIQNICTVDGPHSGLGWSAVQKIKPKQNYSSSVQTPVLQLRTICHLGPDGPQYKNFMKHRNSTFLPIISS